MVRHTIVPPPPDNSTKAALTKGFTLVELAIVLVIIGLIIGGIMVGAELIKQAAFRSEISMIGRYQAAVAAFQLKYNQLPGDFSQANIITGVTHYGNGDGSISINAGGQEYVYVWEHLSKAGYIDGLYDGNYVDGSCALTTCPKSKLFPNNVLWMGGIYGWTGGMFGLPITYSNDITLFWLTPANYSLGSLSIADTKALDIKIDDGVADTGRFLTMNDNNASGGGCVTGRTMDAAGTVDYRASASTVNQCRPAYVMK